MDEANPLYLNKTPKQILGSLNIQIRADAQASENYDEFILEWMADIYTYMQWQYSIQSSEIVEKIPPEKLYAMYNPLHETSLTNGGRKLYELFIQ